MTLNDFLIRHPEFKNTDVSLVKAMLAEATLEVDPNVWGNLSDTGIGYLACHKLALSPYGQNARLVTKDGTTTYQTHYARLVRIVASGFRVTAYQPVCPPYPYTQVNTDNPSTLLSSAMGSLSLPQSTIYVLSTAGFLAAGTIYLTTTAGKQAINYTSLLANAFAGCSGGAGLLTTGTAVTIQ